MPPLPRIAIILVNDAPPLTAELACYLETGLAHPSRDIHVVEPAGEGFTRGMYEGYRRASETGGYDAYWFLKSGVAFDYGSDVLPNLACVLFSNDDYAQISPEVNSPHRFMENARREARRVPYLEPVATLIKASTIETVGFWDLDLTHGWGVDYDYGYRIRQAGLLNILTDRARIAHREGLVVPDWPAYVERASAQMQAVLGAKYGPDWARILQMRRVLPVILTCDRDFALTSQFVCSFHSVRHGMEPPLIVVDTSASTRLSGEFLALLASTEPKAVYVHPRQNEINLYESIQDAADFALAVALEEGGDDFEYLFIEDDILFSSHFLERLQAVRADDSFGFLTFYLPGEGYSSQDLDAGHFYGTQCVLFSHAALECLVHQRAEMYAAFPPGYDIRWSRFLASKGFRLYACERSYVQHLSRQSRLHQSGTHASNCFLP